MSAPANLTQEQQDQLIAQAVESALGQDRGSGLGPFILGFGADLVMLGIMFAQLVEWSDNSRHNKWYINVMVIGSALTAVATSCYGVYFMFDLFVYGYGEWLPFGRTKYTLNYLMFSMPIIAFAQAFYADRAYRLHKTIVIPIIAGIGMCIPIAAALAGRINGIKYPLIVDAGKLHIEIYAWAISITIVDFFLTGCILLGLWRMRKNTTWYSTQKALSRMIRVSFEAQIPPTTVGLIILILYALDPMASKLYGFCICHAKVYVTGMLAALNSRNRTKMDMGGTGDQYSGNKSKTNFKRSAAADIQIFTNTVSHSESYKLDHLPTPDAAYNSRMSDPELGNTLEYQDSRSQLVDRK